jgi:hypothetical protein
MTRERKIPGTNRSLTPPPVANVPNPGFPLRSGVNAAGTAILIFVAMFCIFQYWLLTATLEAYHAGDDDLPLGAFLASLGCFILATGLALLNEIALIKQQDFLRKSLPHKAVKGPDDYPGTISSLHAEERNPYKGQIRAGGGDAG